MARRLLITVERESVIELDEGKMPDALAWMGYDREPAAHNLEGRVQREMTTDDFASVDDIARIMGTDDGFDKYFDTTAEVELQEKCEKHDEWYPLSPKRLAGCWKCINERRDQ